MDEKTPLPPPPTYYETYGSNMNQTQPPPGQQYPPSQGNPAPIQYPPVQGYPQPGGQYPPPQGYPQQGVQYPPTIVAATSNVTVVDQTEPPPLCPARCRALIIAFAIIIISLIIMVLASATSKD